MIDPSDVRFTHGGALLTVATRRPGRERFRSAGRRRSAFLLCATLVLAHATLAIAQTGGQGASGGPGGGVMEADGRLPVAELRIEIVAPRYSPAETSALRDRVKASLAIEEGDRLERLLLERGVSALRAMPDIAEASFDIRPRVHLDDVMLVVRVRARDRAEAEKPSVAAQPPVLHRDEKTYVRILLNGGLGAFSDGSPWFNNPYTFTRGNPLVRTPALGAGTGAGATWTEGYVEYGLGGVTQLGAVPLYIYGAITGISPWSIGRDIFRDDARTTTNVEKLYAGVLYAPKDGDLRVNLSVGRQNFSLNEGFVIQQYGAQWNAGPRPGIYLAPRTTMDQSALLTVKSGPWTSTSFYLDPNEFEPLESKTKLLGTNLRYNFSKSFFADATYLTAPESKTAYPTPYPTMGPYSREGLQLVSGHVRWADPAIAPGVWMESEIAHQWNDRFPMSAWGGYGLVGYLARDVAWTPSISYRFASLSGDDPNTTRYERYDPLFSGGLSEWLQGITINKALSQANRSTHRIRINVAPNERLNLTLDWFKHTANQTNNPGGNPALSQLRSSDLGQEFQFASRWAISRNFYFVGVASHAMPGQALKEAVAYGPDTDRRPVKPWSSLQAQLYWNW